MGIFDDFKDFVKLKTSSAPNRTRSNAVSRAIGQDRQPAERALPVTPPSGLTPLAGLPSLAQLKRHVEAYNKARYFHVTPIANVESILRGGLDPQYGGSDKGASAHSGTDSNRDWSKNKVHVGHISKAIGYERELRSKKPETLRVFVTKGQKEDLAIDRDDPELSKLSGSEIDKADGFWTNQHLMPNQLMQGSFSDATIAKLRDVFAIVRNHYEGDRPSVDTIINWHFRAMKVGLISYKVKEGKGTPLGGLLRDSF